jgi:predicted PurR-regulated permease PerM
VNFQRRVKAKTFITSLINVVKNIILFSTLISFVLLIGLFFYFLYTKEYVRCALCLGALYVFTILNEKV